MKLFFSPFDLIYTKSAFNVKVFKSSLHGKIKFKLCKFLLALGICNTRLLVVTSNSESPPPQSLPATYCSQFQSLSGSLSPVTTANSFSLSSDVPVIIIQDYI